MKKSDMNQEILNFQAKSVELTAQFHELSDLIQKGLVPTREITATMNRTIENLDEIYTKIISLTQAVMPEEDTLPPGQSIFDYERIYQDYYMQQLRSQFDQLKKILHSFICVQSKAAAYTDALKPSQEETHALLNRMENEILEDTETRAQRLFLLALRHQQLDSPDGEQLLDELDQHFPSKVLRGLITKKYFEAQPTPRNATVDNPPFADTEPPSSDDVTPPQSDHSDSTEGFISPTVKLKNKAPSASAFQKEILKCDPEVNVILPLLTHTALLTADQMFRFLEGKFKSSDTLISALDALIAKHLLASYEYEDGNLAYCLTAYCCGCLKKETISTKMKGFWAFPFGKIFYSAQEKLPIDEVKTILEKNNSLLTDLPHPPQKTIVHETPDDPAIHTQQTEQNDPIHIPAETPCFHEEDPMLLAQKLLQQSDPAGQQPSEQAFSSLIKLLLKRGLDQNENGINDWMDAALLAKTAALLNYPACDLLYRQLVLASAIPMKDVHYTGVCLSTAFDLDATENEEMMLAAYLFAMFAPDEAYDHTLQVSVLHLFDAFETHFPSFPMVKSLFHLLLNVQKQSMTGFSEAVLSRLGSESSHEAYLTRLQTCAASLVPEPIIKAKMHGLPELRKACFGLNSDLHNCMELIANGQKDPQTKQQLKALRSNYCEEGDDSSVISESRIEDIVDLEWKNAKQGKSTFRMQLSLLPRRQIIEAFHERLHLISEWLEATDTMQEESSRSLNHLKAELLETIPQTIDALSHAPNQQNDKFVLHILEKIQNRLLGKQTIPYIFSPLLRTGIFSLDQNNLPIMPPSVLYYEPWRNALRHIAAPVCDLQTVRAEIFQNDSARFDNLNQLSKLERLASKDDSATPAQSSLSVARLAEETAEMNTTQFLDTLALADMYHQIDKNEKEEILHLLSEYKDEFFEIGDFGCWRAFLNALKRHIDLATAKHETALSIPFEQCQSLLTKDESSELLDAIHTLIKEKKNFALAEEYLFRFTRGERKLPTPDTQKSNEFLEFLSSDCYDKCAKNIGKELKVFGAAEEQFLKNPSREQIEERRKFLNSWVSAKETATPSQLKQLFECLGFSVLRVEPVPDSSVRFQVYTAEKNQSEYTHPIAAFGTLIHTPFDVLCLQERFTAKQLTTVICEEKLEHFAIVLLDRPMDRAMRRQIAEVFHNEARGAAPFLVLDQALALYLAAIQPKNRLNIFLKCTLPYSLYAPFIRDGVIPDEMFFGRVAELNSIADPNGTMMIYGKLGKTALLTRAETLCTRIDKREYAVKVNLSGCTEEAEVTQKLMQTIQEKTMFSFQSAKTLAAFCEQMQLLFQKKQISMFLLLLDDADAFLEHMETMTAPIQALLDLKKTCANQFKCVFSALHRVQGHLRDALGTPLPIGPLLPKDAHRLLQKPLEYLGFVTQENLDALLVNTNYYPALVQLVGDTLTQTVTDEYANFYCAAENNPPFPLEDRQLGVILNSAALNQRIRDGICAVLESDPRYFMLAHCIALLYFYNSDDCRNQPDCSVDDIKQMAEDYNIHCLAKETYASYTVLLGEMTDMAILTTTHKHETYHFRQHCFLYLIGNDLDSVDQAIHNFNDEV